MPAHLARLSREKGFTLLYISTDYVFNGRKWVTDLMSPVMLTLARPTRSMTSPTRFKPMAVRNETARLPC